MSKYFLHLRYCLRIYFFLLVSVVVFTQVQAQSKILLVRNDRANPLQGFTVPSARQSHPAFVDIDNDGDMDCFSGEFNYSGHGIVSSHISFFKNEGDAKHPLFKEISGAGNPLYTIAITGLIIPVFADIDNDGDEDCFISNSDGAISFYENTGSVNQARFVSTDKSNDPFIFINNKTINTLSVYDWKKDGRTDIFVNGNYYQNNSENFSKISSLQLANNNNEVAACWVNLNNDGTPEMVSGTSDGKFDYSTITADNVKAITYIKVSPNPTTKNFTIYLQPSDEKRILKIVNADNKVMSMQNITSNNYVLGDNFSPGTYFVQIISSDKITEEQKIVKL